MAPAHDLKIAIIGAGPTSLTLCNILQAHNISFTLYESSPTLRNQGGTLDLHPQGGQLALREAGLWRSFVKYARPEADCLKLVDADRGVVVWDENGAVQELDRGVEQLGDEEMEGRPEIDRAMLMRILSEGLTEGCVEFGRKVVEVVASREGGNRHDVCFADGSVERGLDLVVGGDGAWSRVRNILTDTKPSYSGISGVELNAFDSKTQPWLEEYVGAGNMFAFGEGCAVQAQRQGDGSLRTYASMRVPEDFMETCGIDWKEPQKAKEELLSRYLSHIGPDLQRLVRETNDSLVARSLYELPVGFSWAHRPGVTLIGDAAHVMTPFAGVGVNVGMADALHLGRAVTAAARGEKSLESAVREYEVEMWARAEKNAAKTAKNKESHFAAGGAGKMAAMLRKFKGDAASVV